MNLARFVLRYAGPTGGSQVSAAQNHIGHASMHRRPPQSAPTYTCSVPLFKSGTWSSFSSSPPSRRSSGISRSLSNRVEEDAEELLADGALFSTCLTQTYAIEARVMRKMDVARALEWSAYRFAALACASPNMAGVVFVYFSLCRRFNIRYCYSNPHLASSTLTQK